MKIVVIGGSGLIGKKLVSNLKQLGHEVIAASPSLGINSVTGEGLTDALNGAEVVVDVTNSPSFEDKAVLEFFETSTRHLLAAEEAAGVKHHVALSVVGTEGLLQSGYFRAKIAQENLIKASKIPYTIVRATQFFEFVGGIAYTSTEGDKVRLSSADVQPIAAEDVSEVLVDFTLDKPSNGIREIAGPKKFGLDEFVRQYLIATQDARQVVTDDKAPYFGTELKKSSLLPDDSSARLTSARYADWLKSIAVNV
ncbi:SDR family oxidoreductase [Paenibacillus sp. ATY16]|uniref:SDR family oxidoreductase n=1 Tax=Paenibacillus sp. ATY16 TaxID=1759312 RepID=UPI00200D1CB8|nr:SDR family oxidoreductase [Paenibacillus sp. ATY16]MCK9861222.1 SDR family oxidoreductase [Paenibacillus sp. ATY16]